MPMRSHNEDDDDDEGRPVFRGSRNYEGPGTVIADAFGDLTVSVKKAAGHIKESIESNAKRNEMLEQLGKHVDKVGEQFGHTMAEMGDKFKEAGEIAKQVPVLVAEKAKSEAGRKRLERELAKEREEVRSRNQSGLPSGCFCDMRGFACPLHRGQEKWRLAADYRLHLKHNTSERPSGTDSAGSSSSGNGLPACGTRSSDKDSAKGGSLEQQKSDQQFLADQTMAQLVAMGFDPKRIAKVLEQHRSLEAATHALLDDPQDTFPSTVAAQPSGSHGSDVRAPAHAQPAERTPEASIASLITFDEPETTSCVSPSSSNLCSVPTQCSTTSCSQQGGCLAFSDTSGTCSAAQQPLSPATARAAFSLPPGWHLCKDASSGLPYYFCTATKQSQWEPPSEVTSSVANAGSPSTNVGAVREAAPASTATEKQLPTGWHECVDTATGVPYYFNTATKQSQWTRPAPVLSCCAEMASSTAPHVLESHQLGVEQLASLYGLSTGEPPSRAAL